MLVCCFMSHSERSPEQVCSSHPDLMDLPLEIPDFEMIMDGSSLMDQGQQRAGCKGDPSAIVQC